MTFVVRDATPGDAIEIAAVHVASWRTTYAGLLPGELFVSRTNVALRVEQWRTRLAEPGHRTLVALTGDVVCGFASWCPMPERPHDHEPLPGFDAYLSSLYLLQSVQRRGLGRLLLAATAHALRDAEYRALALHVLAENPTRRFYERLGAAWIRDEPVTTAECWFECAYGWPDLAVLGAGVSDTSSR